MMRRLAPWPWSVFLAPMAQAIELAPQRLAENVYGLIGPTGARTHDDHGLNANFGSIVTNFALARPTAASTAVTCRLKTMKPQRCPYHEYPM
jgi:hypothetical protein